MSTWGKAITLVIVALFLTLALLTPLMINAQITSSYSNNTNINPAAFTLTIYSPDNQTYNSIMPLNFTIDWTTYPTFSGLPSPPAPIMNGVYSYTIDNNSAVIVTSNQSSSDVLDPRGFKVNPTFSYSVNVSNLANGYHKIVITASLSELSGGGSIHFSASSSPVLFLVQNSTSSPTTSPTPSPSSMPTPTPSPSPSEQPTKTPEPQPEPSPTTLIIASIVSVAIIGAALLVYFRKRNNAKINKHSEIE